MLIKPYFSNLFCTLLCTLLGLFLLSCQSTPPRVQVSVPKATARSIATNEVESSEQVELTPSERQHPTAAELGCQKYTVYYIDPSTQFFTPPTPIEDYAEFTFCSEHRNLDEIRIRLKKMNPVRSQADLDSARIKVVPTHHPDDAITFCASGEITYHGKQYRLNRRVYEPSLLSLTEEGDRQRAMAMDQDDDDRGPASKSQKSH